MTAHTPDTSARAYPEPPACCSLPLPSRRSGVGAAGQHRPRPLFVSASPRGVTGGVFSRAWVVPTFHAPGFLGRGWSCLGGWHAGRGRLATMTPPPSRRPEVVMKKPKPTVPLEGLAPRCGQRGMWALHLAALKHGSASDALHPSLRSEQSADSERPKPDDLPRHGALRRELSAAALRAREARFGLLANGAEWLTMTNCARVRGLLLV